MSGQGKCGDLRVLPDDLNRLLAHPLWAWIVGMAHEKPSMSLREPQSLKPFEFNVY
ncbi:MAG: hypothetical protein Q4A28_03390 [Brachymonas sp.]|nr:hypothetical protein [Brachymonas sp.]